MSKLSRPPRKGDWRVMRDCCVKGDCIYCFQRPQGQAKTRIAHASDVTERHANILAASILDLNPIVERIR